MTVLFYCKQKLSKLSILIKDYAYIVTRQEG